MKGIEDSVKTLDEQVDSFVDYRGKGSKHWYYGAYFVHVKRTLAVLGDRLRDHDVEHLIIKDEFSDWGMPRGINAMTVLPETVGQFSGMHDRNYKRLYLGDIVIWDGRLALISKHLGSWIINCINKAEYHDLYGTIGFERDNNRYRNKDVELVGNRWDNPELLELAGGQQEDWIRKREVRHDHDD